MTEQDLDDGLFTLSEVAEIVFRFMEGSEGRSYDEILVRWNQLLSRPEAWEMWMLAMRKMVSSINHQHEYNRRS